MHNGAEQTSLWQQSDLLDLVAAAESLSPAPPEPVATPAASRDEAEAGAAGPAGFAAAQESTAPSPGTAWADGPHSAPGEPKDASHSSRSSGVSQAEGVTPTDWGQTPQAPPTSCGQRSPADRPDPAAEPAASGTQDHDHEPPTRQDACGPSASADQGSAPDPGCSTPASLPACPQRLLILDTETTALNPQQGQCIEVGAVLFDVASRAVLMQVSFLMPCSANPAEHVNGIPAAVSQLQQPWRSGLACFEAMVTYADVLLAHNAAFDRQWFGSGELPALDKPWICSMEDIRWPAERQLRATPSVRDLALAYGVPVWAAHRALTDCIYLVQVFQRCEHLEALLQAALEPRRLVRARLSYDERQLAKDAGFRWNEPVPKAWSRRLSEREIAALPFAVDPVEAEEPGRQRREPPQPLWRRSA